MGQNFNKKNFHCIVNFLAVSHVKCRMGRDEKRKNFSKINEKFFILLFPGYHPLNCC